MKIHSVSNQNSFKAVSINSKTGVNIGLKTRKLAEESISKINETMREGAAKSAKYLSSRLDSITAEMDIRRKIEREKPWYKFKKYDQVDKMEAKQKLAVVKEQDEILSRIKDENKKTEQIKNEYCQNISIDDNNEAELRHVLRIGDALETLRAKLSGNSKGFQRIAGYDKEKNILDKYFISEIRKEQAGEKADVPNSVLFFGPTGNGKTTFARAFAAETGCMLEKGRSNNFVEMLEHKMQQSQILFQKKGVRTILFIDELDREAKNNPAVISKLKEILPICSKEYHCTVFATTNDPLDIELPLTGKDNLFPYIVSMDPPNSQNKIDILKYYLKERPSDNLDYNKIANLLEAKEKMTGQRYNITQIKEICLNIPDNKFSEQSIIDSINCTKPTIDKEAIDKYLNEMNTLMTNEVHT